MNAVKTFATVHPVWFVLIITASWLLLLIALMGVTPFIFHQPFGPMTMTISRLVLTAGVIVLIWRLGWLEEAGITRLGSWGTWLLTLGGLLYFIPASLYAMYGKVAFDLAHVLSLPGGGGVFAAGAAASLSEEIFFRGLILYVLASTWGKNLPGIIWSVVFTALLFAGLHILQVFTQGLSPASALLLIAETGVIAITWGALVIYGGSVWPAVVFHVLVNVIVALGGLILPMVAPETLAYQRLLLFSLPLGLLGLLLMARTAPNSVLPGASR